LFAGRDPVGVWLAPEDDPARLKPDIELLDLIAVHFPSLPTAAAIPPARCCADASASAASCAHSETSAATTCSSWNAAASTPSRSRPGRDPTPPSRRFDEFSVRYQGSVDDPLPLFRRRQAGAGR
jgi:uncharacterized protein (DUF934 family)